MNSPKSFGSDNHAGVHPDVLEAIASANTGHAIAYGDDTLTHAFSGLVEELFGSGVRGYPVWGGSGANVLGLSALLRPYEAVICAETAHIHTDECGALERVHGGKLLTVPTEDGKLTPDAVAARIVGVGDEHCPQPRVISVTQATELGTCYTPAEIRALATLAHERGLYLHLDGARLAGAAASFGCALRELTTDAGVDVFSLGATKNGALGAEAVVIRPELAREFRFLRKQGMQLASKMRFVSAQLVALFSGDLWYRNAAHANAMAQRLAEGVRDVPGAHVDYPVHVNAVFASLASEHAKKLAELSAFQTLGEAGGRVRWMTAFDTTEADVDAFLADIRATARG